MLDQIVETQRGGTELKLFQHYIGGQFEYGTSTFESIDPSTGKPWAVMPESREDDVDKAVQAAQQALHGRDWGALSATQRGKLLYRLADLVQENAFELARLETQDSGKIIRETSAQISYVADFFRYYAGLADKMEGYHLPIDKPDMEVWLKREPLGVVAAIVPWNSQLFLTAVKIGPALAAGCTVVLKASEDAPAPLLEFARIVHDAGFPPGTVNIITGFGEQCGSVLASHPGVSHVAFTGGPETARHIVRHTSSNLASISLELGGKSPFIVFEDADLDSAANAQVAGIFAAAGQSCVAGSRLIVHNSIKEEFLERLKTQAERVVLGDPSDMDTEVGPLCTSRQLERIDEIVQATIREGAQLIAGGRRLERDGHYYLPTILDCSNNPEAPSVANELFGPVLSVLGFDSDDEALQIANDTQYGLAAGVFTANLARAHRMANAIQAGVVWVNTYRVISPIAPFGGHGISGYGREGGIQAALEYTKLKAVWLNTSEETFPDPFKLR